MNKILRKKILNPSITLLEVHAPRIASKARPGQFIILRVDDHGERIPLTIADFDREKGSITIIFQKAGLTTQLLDQLDEGSYIHDFVGPLGLPTELPAGAKKVCVVGGGVGCAIAYPQAKALYAKGLDVDVIAGFRSKDIVILEEEFQQACSHLYITTDDGSYGEQGFVTTKLKQLIDNGKVYDAVIAIGPIPMMKFVCDTTRPYGIKTIVSLNPIMIDGTGMCGGCRVTVGGETRFACVDGPDFDGHQVDFSELMCRNAIYKKEEADQKSRHSCCIEQLGKTLIQ